jgi:hypothetical protein
MADIFLMPWIFCWFSLMVACFLWFGILSPSYCICFPLGHVSPHCGSWIHGEKSPCSYSMTQSPAVLRQMLAQANLTFWICFCSLIQFESHFTKKRRTKRILFPMTPAKWIEIMFFSACSHFSCRSSFIHMWRCFCLFWFFVKTFSNVLDINCQVYNKSELAWWWLQVCPALTWQEYQTRYSVYCKGGKGAKMFTINSCFKNRPLSSHGQLLVAQSTLHLV